MLRWTAERLPLPLSLSRPYGRIMGAHDWTLLGVAPVPENRDTFPTMIASEIGTETTETFTATETTTGTGTIVIGTGEQIIVAGVEGRSVGLRVTSDQGFRMRDLSRKVRF